MNSENIRPSSKRRQPRNRGGVGTKAGGLRPIKNKNSGPKKWQPIKKREVLHKKVEKGTRQISQLGVQESSKPDHLEADGIDRGKNTSRAGAQEEQLPLDVDMNRWFKLLSLDMTKQNTVYQVDPKFT